MPSSIPSPAFARSKSGFNTAGQRYAPFVPSEDDAWDESRILHLLRRTGHQVTREQIDELASLSPVEAVDRIVNQALSAPLPTPPSWRDDPPPDREAPLEEKQDFFDRNIEQSRRYQADWLAELFKGGLREQMALFWHNHFVTEYPVYHRSAWAYRYVDCLRRNSLGDFKVFVHEIGLSPAMLRYLDGFANSFGRPNENYARELLELFTTGLNNYTERDIKEIARALTGWRIGPIETYFDETRHDRGLKTIFGRVGPFGYDDVIDLVFLERRDEIARFISSKLYAFFVHPQVDDEVVDLMAADFTVNDFNLEVPVRTLLRSNAFFDRGVIGAQIKSPIDFYLGAVHDLAIDVDTWTVRNLDIFWFGRLLVGALGQDILDPPDVSGWPGHHDWISSSSLTARWNMIFEYSQWLDADRILASTTDPANPFMLARELATCMLGQPVSDDDAETLTGILLDGVPHYEWDPVSPGGKARVAGFVQHVMQLPEYQLK